MTPDSFDTPILFVVFNRPDTTRQVFERIKEVRPLTLYVAADGPRANKPEDLSKCLGTRKIIEEIDWECDLHTLFFDTNLGCKIGVSSAIDWFFQDVDRGIILEDDCVPDFSFFHFCQSLLHYYKDDERIMAISGDNFQDGLIRSDGSYYFSKLVHVWGWATWRRAWKHFDSKMQKYPIFKEQKIIASIFPRKTHQKHWLRIFEKSYNNKINSWAYPWVFNVWSQGGLCILPNKNLVTNIGFNKEATHTKFHQPGMSELESNAIGEIRHPSIIMSDYFADLYTLKKSTRPLIYTLKKKISKIIAAKCET